MQIPEYDHFALKIVTQKLSDYPGLVNTLAIEQLQQALASACLGNTFIVHAGDCVESFQQPYPQYSLDQTNMLVDLTRRVQQHLNKPTFCIGRIAGQLAKPRTQRFETKETLILPSYQGDMINQSLFSTQARQANPYRMLTAYDHSKATLSDIQLSLQQSYFDPLAFFISHEALLLPYEQAFTRLIENKWYNIATHFPWLGMRTHDLNGAHVEYLRGIENPIGIKIGSQNNIDDCVKLAKRLNPKQKKGKIIFIHRFGQKQIKKHLPILLHACEKNNLPVGFLCDPMHGNTLQSNHMKTRFFDDIVQEYQSAQAIHNHCGIVLAGIHLETTADDVQECLNNKNDPALQDLAQNYKSAMDPRLNKQQTLELLDRLFAPSVASSHSSLNPAPAKNSAAQR